jgi:Zn-dependent M28 family amino/carboxypeptidase
MLNRRTIACLSILLIAPALLARNDDLTKLDGAKITKHIEVLASPEYEGRAPGTAGGAKAVEYVIAQFQSIGLKAKGTSGFRQPFANKKGVKHTNVVGLLEGSDATLKKEYVVVGAHHDHLGNKDDTLFPGADDNASGVATLLEIAAALKENGAPKRSVLFVTFDGEERGLIGSKHFIEKPPVPIGSIVAMINFDMVSRGAATHVCVCGKSESPELIAHAEANAERAGIALNFDYDAKWRNSSDHGSFANAQIPWLYFGVEDHEDYHKPTDTADKVDRAKIEKIARLGYLTLRGVAEAEKPPGYVKPEAKK